jgi:hypothetical protein
MDHCHVILKPLNVVKNQSPSLADRVVADDSRIYGYIV